MEFIFDANSVIPNVLLSDDKKKREAQISRLRSANFHGTNGGEILSTTEGIIRDILGQTVIVLSTQMEEDIPIRGRGLINLAKIYNPNEMPELVGSLNTIRTV